MELLGDPPPPRREYETQCPWYRKHGRLYHTYKAHKAHVHMLVWQSTHTI